jgi:hypothetical protein
MSCNLVLLCLPHHHAVHDSGWTSRLHADGTVTFTRRGVTITSLPRHEQRFTPTTPPPTGRPTRPQRATGRIDSDRPQPADPIAAAVDLDPPPEVVLPF